MLPPTSSGTGDGMSMCTVRCNCCNVTVAQVLGRLCRTLQAARVYAAPIIKATDKLSAKIRQTESSAAITNTVGSSDYSK
ncbi:hypothetical protein D3C81_1492930 [compost metagenome]